MIRFLKRLWFCSIRKTHGTIAMDGYEYDDDYGHGSEHYYVCSLCGETWPG